MAEWGFVRSKRDGGFALLGEFQQKLHGVFELNKGNHFTDGAGRMARGIRWILEE